MDRAGFGVEAFFRQSHTVFKEIWVSPKIKALPSWVSICCGFVAQLVSTVDKILTDNGSIASCTGLTFIMRGILSLTHFSGVQTFRSFYVGEKCETVYQEAGNKNAIVDGIL